MWYWLPGVILAVAVIAYMIGRHQPKNPPRSSATETGRYPGTLPNRSNAPKPGPGESTETPQGS